jgi:filamentous hemagglutinin family protein
MGKALARRGRRDDRGRGPWRRPRSFTGVALAATLAAAVHLSSRGAGEAAAQVVLDGSFGPARTFASGNITIPHMDGRLAGANLYHSFRTLNITANDVVTFTGPATVERVWARVTDGSPSTISGTLRCDIAGADFYLLNPAGVIFTAGSKIDVTGTFVVSTAKFIRLADGRLFTATPDPVQDALLTTAPPAAFGFGPEAPAGVIIDKSAADRASGASLLHGVGTTPPKRIAIVAGHIAILGADTVMAPTGTEPRPAGVDLIALGSGGELVFDPGDPASEPAGLDTFANLADVELAARTRIDVGSTGAAPGQAGHITIRAANLFLRDASLRVRSNTAPPRGISIEARGSVELSGDSSIRTSTGDDVLSAPAEMNTAAAGPIHIRAGRLDVNGGQIRTQVANGTRAPGGDIDITVGELHLTPGSAGRGEIAASNYGKHPVGGEVRITSMTPMLLDDASAQLTRIFTDAGEQRPVTCARGQVSGADDPGAGNVRIDAPAAETLDGRAVFSVAYGNGSAGNVFLNGAPQVLPSSTVTYDGTLGHAADAVPRLPSGTSAGTFVIGADDGVAAGGNLFYSFGQLSLNRQETLTFTGRTGDAMRGQTIAGLHNVIARVTGGQASVIDGRFGCEGDNVNLFVINPSGVVLGSFARLDLGGSLALTSAAGLRFTGAGGAGAGGAGAGGAGERFMATGAPFAGGVVPVGTVTGFEFVNGASAGPIDVFGLPVTSNRPEKEISRFAIAPNAVLTLAGGGVNIDSRTLAAPSDVDAAAAAHPGVVAAGRVNVVAVAAGDAFVQCDPTSSTAPLAIVRGRAGAQLGPVTLTHKGTIDASGAVSDHQMNGLGGRIDVRAGSVSMTEGAQLLSKSTADVAGASGLGIDVRAEGDVTITESLVFTRATRGSDAGPVTVVGHNIDIMGNGGDPGRGFELSDMGIAAETTGAGRGGDLTVSADDAFTLRFGAAVRSVSNGTGAGGNVSVQARDALIDNGTSTEFTVVAAQTSGIVAGGAGGSVDIGTDGRLHTLEVRNGGSVVATTLGSGAGGRITLSATRSITLDGRDSPASASADVDGPRQTSIDASSRPFDRNDAADLHLTDQQLTDLDHGDAGRITISTAGTLNVVGYAQIVASTQTHGSGGGIKIAAGRVDIGGGRYFTTADGPTLFDPGIFAQAGRDTGLTTKTQTVPLTGETIGNSGTIDMHIGGGMSLRGAGRIGTSTSNEGNAGEINLRIGGTLLMEGRAGSAPESFAAIQSRTGNGSDGRAASGDGGSVFIGAHKVILRDRAEITTESEFNDFRGTIPIEVGRAGGNSGTVRVRADSVVRLEPGTTIRSNAELRGGGGVDLTAGRRIQILGDSAGGRAAVTATAPEVNAGNVTLRCPGRIDIYSGDVTTDAKYTGGDIFIDPFLLSLDFATIKADARFANAGNIDIRAGVEGYDRTLEDKLQPPPVTSHITATSERGISDTELFAQPEIDIIGNLVALPRNLPSTGAQLEEQCVRGLGLPVSSFISAGRGGSPAQPGALKGYLPIVGDERETPDAGR